MRAIKTGCDRNFFVVILKFDHLSCRLKLNPCSAYQ